MAGFGAAQGEPDQIDAVRGDDEGGTVGGPTVTAAGVHAVVREDNRAGGGNRLQARLVGVNETIDGQTAVLAIETVRAVDPVGAIHTVEPVRAVQAIKTIGAVLSG